MFSRGLSEVLSTRLTDCLSSVSLMRPDDRHFRVLVYGLPSPLLGSLLLLLAQSFNTLLLPPLLPGAPE